MDIKRTAVSDDTRVSDACGKVIASFGPRRAGTGPDGPENSFAETADDDTAEFWSVFKHDAEGFAQCIGDATDLMSARNFAVYASRADPLTAARVGMGVQRYLSANASDPPPDARAFLAEIVRFASSVDLAVAGYGDLCGVSTYDIADSFGFWAAGELQLSGELDPEAVREHVRAMVVAACG